MRFQHVRPHRPRGLSLAGKAGIAALIGLICALSTAYSLSLTPPGVHPRQQTVAAAGLHVLVADTKMPYDSPKVTNGDILALDQAGGAVRQHDRQPGRRRRHGEAARDPGEPDRRRVAADRRRARRDARPRPRAPRVGADRLARAVPARHPAGPERPGHQRVRQRAVARRRDRAGDRGGRRAPGNELRTWPSKGLADYSGRTVLRHLASRAARSSTATRGRRCRR